MIILNDATILSESRQHNIKIVFTTNEIEININNNICNTQEYSPIIDTTKQLICDSKSYTMELNLLMLVILV